MKARAQQYVPQKEKCYLAGAVTLLIALACLYMYFLSMTVIEVVLQKEIKAEKNQLYSEISTLEAKYINQQHSMTNEIATLHGFEKTSEKIFIHRGKSSLILSSNDIR